VSGRPGRYTLVVPTYNRTLKLSRLLDYLEREAADFPILVLDSSAEEARRENGGRITRSPLSIRHATYPPEIHPFIKVKEGLELVDTLYCSICADDDVVLLPGLRRSIETLERQSAACAAHGYYFNFSEGQSFDLTYIVYRGSSLLADDALARVRSMFAAYEAVCYAVYRTPIARRVFRRVGELRTLLGRELVTAALTAVAGKVVRVQDFYYGRSVAESMLYEDWHPHQMLVKSPKRLFREYPVLRDIVCDEILEAGDAAWEPDTVTTVLDLVFLRYLAPFLRADVVDLIIEDRLKGIDPDAVVEHLWRVFVRNTERAMHPVLPLSERRTGFGPAAFRNDGPPKDYVHVARTGWNAPRTYRVFHEFVFPSLRPPPVVGEGMLLDMLAGLNQY